MTQITHCPNCGMVWPEGMGVCPHCGFVRSDSPIWPPSPQGRAPLPLAPTAPRLVTGKAWGDMALGVLLSLGSNIFFGLGTLGILMSQGYNDFFGLGLLVMPILYFVLRRRFPIFARGIGYGFLVITALLLGALSWCFYLVFGSGAKGL